jgi:hypothetical protein
MNTAVIRFFVLALASPPVFAAPPDQATPKARPGDQSLDTAPRLRALTADVYSDDPAADARLRDALAEPTPLPTREQTARLLAVRRRPSLEKTLEALATAPDVPVSLRGAAACTLYQWERSASRFERLLVVQKQGAPIRTALRTGFVRGQYLYEKRAEAAFVAGLGSEGSAARVDAALGLFEIERRLDEAKPTLIAEVTSAERADDRLAALTAMATLPPAPWMAPAWKAATNDRDVRVRDAARAAAPR